MYTNAQVLPPGRVAPLSRVGLVHLRIISDADEGRDLDDDFGKEDDYSESDVDDEGVLFPMV